VPLDLTVALAGLGLWLGLALLVVGLLGPLIVRNPAHRMKFASSIAVGVVLVVVALWLMAVAIGFGPDRP
jgi:predicted ABC-type exoprotein transport system permease subunit